MTKEEQRYGRDKSTLVNHSYINSAEYRKKFDNISEDRKLNRLLYGIAKKMLCHRSGTKLEDMYWIELSSLEVICKVIDSVEESRISYPFYVENLIRKFDDLITIHSHLAGNPPSVADFNSAYRNNYV